jgi:zinc transport system permease protein
MPFDWMTWLIERLAGATDTPFYSVKAVVAVVLVCLVCGMVGSLVVGNGMAFFSDAMAHCAFAGITIGYLSVLFTLGPTPAHAPPGEVAWRSDLTARVVPLVMILFGALVGVAMVQVRERTALENDTVIGVFFAGAIGLGAALFKVLQNENPQFNPENFLFGSVLFVLETDLVYLTALLLVTGGVFLWRYNQLLFASFSPSLARTRRINLRLNDYLFVVLLALVVNLSIRAVGALLINALLVVPAAAAANVSRNLRQMFWLTVVFCVGSGLFGYWVSTVLSVPGRPGGRPLEFGPSGMIVITCVAVFFLTMFGGWARRRVRPAAVPA